MASLCIDLSQIEVREKQEVSRDEAYLWVFGIVVDLATISKQSYVVEYPCTHGNLGDGFKKGEKRDIPRRVGRVDLPITPVAGIALGGVVVVAWEHDALSEDRQREGYRAMCRELNGFIVDRVRAGEFSEPTSSQLKSLQRDVEGSIKAAFTADNPKILQVLKALLGGYDEFIGSDYVFKSLESGRDSRESLALKFCPSGKSIDYRIAGSLRFTS